MTTMWKLDTEITLKSLACYRCGVVFAMPDSLIGQRKQDGDSFWCPNGHPQCFRETEAAKLRRQLEFARSSATSWQDQAEAAARSLRATRGHLTRARNRQRAGVCPADGCSRHFQNLQRHIATKHPELSRGD